MKPYKVILSGGGTGGHLYPALAIANAFKIRNPNAEILFVGALGRIEMEKVPQAGYKIIGLWIDGLQRSISLRNLTFPLKLVFSLLKSIFILYKFKPDVVVGTGGYASGPLLFMASIFKIPTLIQEQNSYPGITNKLLSKLVNTIAVAYERMERFFPAHKIVTTGNPIRKTIVEGNIKKQQAKEFFDLKNNDSTLVVLGGSLGAKRINELVATHLDFFKKLGVLLIWQCGALYYDQFKKYQSEKVKIIAFVSEMDHLYAAADMIISRSGAATLSELCVVSRPVLLIPSPNVTENHQYHNAMALEQKLAALVIEEKNLEKGFKKIFLDLIEPENQKKMTKNIKELAIPDATSRIVDLTMALL